MLARQVHLLIRRPGAESEDSILEEWDSCFSASGDSAPPGILHLVNQKPKWNEDVGMWSLGFEGEVRSKAPVSALVVP